MVKPLTLEELQKETLKLIKMVKKQLHRVGFEEGLSDDEFEAKVLDPLMFKITNDMEVLNSK